MRHWTYALVGLVLASGVLTACGGSDDESPASGGTGGGTGGTGVGGTGGTGVGGTGGLGGTGGSTGGTGGIGGTGGSTGGTGGSTGGTGGTGGSACTAPAAPSTPTPANAANNIDPTTTSLDWDDAADAVSYDVYFGDTCPPPAYPDAAYENMTASEVTSLTLSGSTDYCWKVVAIGDGADCFTEGPSWSFSTACALAATPTGPVPADGATNLDATATTALDWDDADGAATYDVYFGDTCPPPAYPDASYQNVSASELTGLTLADSTSYCWKVVALDATGDCAEEGPDWVFDTTCVDPVAGAPTVTSTDMVQQATGTSGTYTLTFNEDVINVASSLTWTATTGTGTLGAVTALDGQTYEVAFTGIAPGDVYTLTVGSSVRDACGTPLGAAVNLTITISAGGAVCSAALDLDNASFPVQMTGTFGDDPAIATSCDDSPTNVAWYTFTAQTTGTHHIEASNATSTDAYSRLAIYEGTTCPPSGSEVVCDTADGTSIESFVEFTQGTVYTILFFTDGNSYTNVDPELTITPITWMPGQDCSQPLDLTGAAFPYTATGNFPYASSEGGSCDATPNNMAWFTYTPSVSGWHDITGTLATASVPVRLAVFESAACNPSGTELACELGSSVATTMVDLTQGTEYLVLFHTSDATDEMTDPTIDIAPTVFADGELCEQPFALTDAGLPYTATGTFEYDFTAGGSCGASAYNAVWYTYTPGTTGWYEIAAQTTNASAYARLAVFDTVACDPHGAEVACVATSTPSATSTLELTQGTTYLIGFYSGYDADDITDPTIDISPVTIAPGEMCAGPIELTGATFPYTATGTFTQDPTSAGTCDSSPYNAAWFSYTPTTTGYYDILAQNGNATSQTRLAVFDSTSCSPLGAQRVCDASTTDTAASTLYLNQNTTYLLAFYTNSDAEQMLNPVIDIGPASLNAGESCATAIDVTGATFPYAVTGTFDLELGSGGACDTTPTNMVWFRHTAPTTEAVDITLTNATTTNAYSRVVVFEGSDCSSLGTELACVTSSGKTGTATVGMTQGTEYLIGFYTDGETYTMVDPTITIGPKPPGYVCASPANITGATFPYQLTGDFTDDAGAGGTCDTTPNNIVWFTYTPSTTGSYTINAVNATTTYAYSRLAVFESASCAPTGTELACETASGKSVSATLNLTQGTEYLFMFYTDGASYTMIDPTIEVVAN